MTDIVERLRARWEDDDCIDAADEIERLQEYKRKQMADIMDLGQQVGKLEIENERLRALLERIMPFAPEGLWQEARRALEGSA